MAEKIKPLSDERMIEICEKALKNYKGNVQILESAIGALVMGRMLGWHVLRLIHSSRTYSSYEKILGVKFKEILPPRTKESTSVYGIRMADGIGKFWQALAGGMLATQEAKEKTALT